MAQWVKIDFKRVEPNSTSEFVLFFCKQVFFPQKKRLRDKINESELIS